MATPTNIASSYARADDICLNCKVPTEIVEDFGAGDLICTNCGLVLAQRMVDLSSEWRTFSNDNAPTKDKSRVGSGEDMFDDAGIGLSTSIVGAGDKDGSSNLARLQNRSTMQGDERALMDAYRELSAMGERMNAPDMVVQYSRRLYNKIYSDKKVKGRPAEAAVAACLFIGCKQRGVPRTWNEVCRQTNVSKKDVARCYKIISELLKDDLGRSRETEVVGPQQYLNRFCNQLGVPQTTLQLADHVATTVHKLGIAGGRGPTTVAAASIYLACCLSEHPYRKSYKEVGEVAGVSETTIKQAYKVFYQERHRLITDPVMLRGRVIDELPSN